MPIDTALYYAFVDDLYLDPENPRLGRRNTAKNLSQAEILELMKHQALEELAVSFLESAYWPQEAVIVVEEEIAGSKRLVVVEGNRRLAALKLLRNAKNGGDVPKKWRDLVSDADSKRLEELEQIPYIKAESRYDVQGFLGFRHVTGIKEWQPAEKAEYIARLIDEEGKTYRQVMRLIGSKTNVVRQNYISYRLLLQMDGMDDEISLENVEEKFSVLYLSLRASGVRAFLDIDIQAEPEAAQKPVPREKLQNLAEFALWLFGKEEQEPLISDSRKVDNFGKILESTEAVAYLRRSKHPVLETAYRIAGGTEAETIELIESAADNLEQALSTVHHHLASKYLQKAVLRLGKDAFELINKFPDIKKELLA